MNSFAPIINDTTQILILGTMPGATSLQEQEYYAYKHNHFWRIIYTVFDQPVIPTIFKEKIKILEANKVGLWDVLAYCERKGSLDSNIKNHVENDFIQLFATYPSINKIIFNGKESHKYFLKKFGQIEGISYHVMPSTSPANTISFEKKLESWKEVLK